MRQSSKFASLLVTLPMQPKAGPSSPGSAMAPHDSRTNRDQEVKMCLVVSNVHLEHEIIKRLLTLHRTEIRSYQVSDEHISPT